MKEASAPSGTGAGRLPSRARILARLEAPALKLSGIVVVLALWEIATASGFLDAMFTSSPRRIATALLAYVRTDQFVGDLRASGLEFAGGFGLAVVIGIGLGLLTGLFRRIEYVLDPIINFLYAAPRIALTPLLILWLGIGFASKIAIVFLMGVFPLIINTALGIRSVDRDLVDLARSFNASRWQIVRTIILPFSIPYIVTGIRLAIGVGFIGVVVGEFVAATAGIGFSIRQAASNFEVDQVFVGLILIGFAGVALTEALRYVETRLAKWRA
jgi:ABC-type nitrate/sulfonate/bicarbonate transport system permease component